MNKKNIKRNILRKTKMGVAVLQIVLMVSLNMLSVPAAAPKVSVDETVYANLDYYGVGKYCKRCKPKRIYRFQRLGRL